MMAGGYQAGGRGTTGDCAESGGREHPDRDKRYEEYLQKRKNAACAHNSVG